MKNIENEVAIKRNTPPKKEGEEAAAESGEEKPAEEAPADEKKEEPAKEEKKDEGDKKE